MEHLESAVTATKLVELELKITILQQENKELIDNFRKLQRKLDHLTGLLDLDPYRLTQSCL